MHWLMIYLKKLPNRQEKFNAKEEGSITVFLALTLILVLSFVFSMAESARVNGLQELAERKLFVQMQSAFGAYNQELWEHYGLLFLDMSYGSGELGTRLLESHMMEEDYAQGDEAHFYQMALKDIEAEAYSIATDGGGAAFKQQACEAAKERFAVEGMELLEEQVEIWQALETQNGNLEQKWQEALEAEEEAESYKESQNETAEKLPTEPLSTKPLPENPISYVTQLKSSSLLALVLEEPSELSGKGIDTASSLDKRELFCGNMTVEEGDSVDKMWFVQYLNQYFQCRTDIQDSSHALDYELEYCIGGKETDVQNLEAVVEKLLLIREGANFTAIMQDAEKTSMAMEIAAAAVGFTGIMPLIKAVQIGILLAWSYVESIVDVRCLLAGGKVPLMKDSSGWKSDLFHIEEIPQDSGTKDSGLSYREYLQILLYTAGEGKLTSRAMDVVERNIRLFSGNESMRMDAMVSTVRVNAVYCASPLFFNLVPMTQKIDGSYCFCVTQKFAY